MRVCKRGEVKKSPLVKMAADRLAGLLPSDDQPEPSHQQPGFTPLGLGLSPALPQDHPHTFEEWPVEVKGGTSAAKAGYPATLL